MTFAQDQFEAMPLIGILRGIRPEALNQVIPLYINAGLTTLEITMNTPGFSKMLSKAVHRYGDQINIGAGTVCTAKDLQKALQAGAQFIVSPIINKKVIAGCVERNIPVFPGALTPNEIHRAWVLGATMVKVYPAHMFGPSYIKDVLAPLDKLKLLPTGGINLENMKAYYEAGAKGFGLGSLLFDQQLIREGKWKELQQKMELAVANFQKLQ